jgi:hypothetical protein
MQSEMHIGAPLSPAAHATSWRAVLSALLAIAILLSSFHHLSCLGDDEVSGPGSSISVALETSAPPVNGDPCLPGHCHCVCHVSVQALTDSVSNPVDFGNLAYGLRADRLPRALATLPPFKPPRA